MNGMLSDDGFPQPVRSALRASGRVALVAVLYFIAGKASFALSVSHDIVTLVVFLAEGSALAAVIIWGRGVWPGILIGQFILALTNHLPWPLALGIGAINSIEALIGATLFHRLKIHVTYDRLRDVGWLLALIFLVLQPFSATLGTLLLWIGGRIPVDDLPIAWLSWWFGNALGQTILTPLLLKLASPAHDTGRRIDHLIASLILALAIDWLVFHAQPISGVVAGIPLSAPLMVLLAALCGMTATTFGTLVVTGITLYHAHGGLGPFSTGAYGGIVALDFFLLQIALTGQFAAALFAEHKTAERIIRRDHEWLNLSQRIANLGSWRINLRSSEMEWSDEFFRILEANPAVVGPTESTFIDRVHPDDRERLTKTFAEARERRMPYECTHRMLLPNGRLKHVRARGEIDFSPKGEPLEFHGTLLDITGIRAVEEKLNLYGHIFRQSGEAIVITDHENNIVDVNPAFTQLTGYLPEEVIGKNPRVLASGKTPPETYPVLWQALERQGTWCGELWDRRKDGSIYPKWACISAIRDPSGEIVNYFASFVDITERKIAEDRIQQIAHHDALTGLLNRFSLEDCLQQALHAARRENRKLAVMFLDMNRFKIINDTLGHHIGDLLLIEVGRRLVTCARASDIVARLGGDEFVVVLTGAMDEGAAAGVAQKIVEYLEQPYILEQHTLQSSASVGIGLFPEHGNDVGTLMQNADTAMYVAKQQGGNDYRFFDPAMTAELRR